MERRECGRKRFEVQSRCMLGMAEEYQETPVPRYLNQGTPEYEAEG
jgi:hypothetical protein